MFSSRQKVEFKFSGEIYLYIYRLKKSKEYLKNMLQQTY